MANYIDPMRCGNYPIGEKGLNLLKLLLAFIFRNNTSCAVYRKAKPKTGKLRKHHNWYLLASSSDCAMKNPCVRASTLALGPGLMAILVPPSAVFTSIAIRSRCSLEKHSLQQQSHLCTDYTAYGSDISSEPSAKEVITKIQKINKRCNSSNFC